MNARHVDVLVRTVAERGTRRGLLGFLAMLSLGGGLAAHLGAESISAKGRRTKARHERPLNAEKKRKKKKRKKCKPQALATTCDGNCGTVRNNCKKPVDCGSDACEPGTVCLAGTCATCGAIDDPCCAGAVCLDDAHVCLAGTCQDCGYTGHPCCAGETCKAAGLSCVNGTCDFP